MGRNMRQRANLGRWKDAGGVWATAVRSALLAAAVVASTSIASTAWGQASGLPGDPSVEALLARGIVHSAGSEMRAGLDELRAAVRLEPGHALARGALAVALLRGGRFGEAEAEFAVAVGEERARALASGRASSADLPGSVDADALLGLATSVQLQGRTREADRLYRAYADVVGPMSENAGRAYFRLHELATDSGVEWLDAEAELAKALAVDPNVRTAMLLPGFPDPRTHPELEPYVRPIELSASRADTAVEYDTLPLLSRWVAPADTSEALVALGEGKLRLEILVNADGLPVEVVPITAVTDEELTPVTNAVGAWRFTPARAEGADAPAWILFGEEGEAEAADGEEAGRMTGEASEAQ
ncbi:MAG: hypothetical protein ABIE42_11470 [Candidatus Eisenbacteria bacterium]